MNKYSIVSEKLNENTDYTEKVDIYMPTQSSSPILYFFSSIGFWIGRVFNFNIVIALYLARMFNLIVSLILAYYSLKLIPLGKKVLMIYLFTPMYFQQGCSLSYDSIINAVTIFFIAYTIYLILRDKDINIKESVLIYILIIIIATSKYVYIPLVGVLFLFIPNKNISKKNKIVIISIAMTLAIILSLGSYIFSGKYIEERSYVTEMNVNSAEQIRKIVNNPIIILKVLYNSIKEDCEMYIFTFVGSNLGWLNIDINYLIIVAFLLLLLLTPFLEKNKKEINFVFRLICILIFVAISILIILGLYLGWSPVGWYKAVGIQGRYFIPCVILLLFCLTSKTKYIEFKNINIKLLITVFILNILTIIQVIENFI